MILNRHQDGVQVLTSATIIIVSDVLSSLDVFNLLSSRQPPFVNINCYSCWSKQNSKSLIFCRNSIDVICTQTNHLFSVSIYAILSSPQGWVLIPLYIHSLKRCAKNELDMCSNGFYFRQIFVYRASLTQRLWSQM